MFAVKPSIQSDELLFVNIEQPFALQALADSIAEHGMLNLPTVYRDPETGRYRPVAGERRWRAALLLGWTTMRVRLFKGKPSEQQRQDIALVSRPPGILAANLSTRTPLLQRLFNTCQQTAGSIVLHD